MRPALLVLPTALLGLAVAPYPQQPASASCVGPSFVDHRIVLDDIGPQVVEGEYFVDGCRDSMSCSSVLGCDSCEYDDPPPRPRLDVGLELRQDGRAWSLGTADADADGFISWAFRVPDGVHPGPARLVADGATRVVVRIR